MLLFKTFFFYSVLVSILQWPDYYLSTHLITRRSIRRVTKESLVLIQSINTFSYIVRRSSRKNKTVQHHIDRQHDDRVKLTVFVYLKRFAQVCPASQRTFVWTVTISPYCQYRKPWFYNEWQKAMSLAMAFTGPWTNPMKAYRMTIDVSLL